MGSETGNGGAAVACRDGAGKLIRVDLLDLYEGYALYGRGYTESARPSADQALSYAFTLDQILNAQVPKLSMEDRLKSIISRMKFLPEGVGLKPTDDLGNFIVPKDCGIVQAINYRDDREIFADSEIWNRFTETQKAAAYIHEAIYEYARENGSEDTSARVRSLVSLLFANLVITPVIPDDFLRSAQTQICTAGNSVFLLNRDATGKLDLAFTQLEGHTALASISAHGTDSAISEMNLVSVVDRGFSAGLEFTDGEPVAFTLLYGTKKIKDTLKCKLNDQNSKENL
jgi:hypothetical protein